MRSIYFKFVEGKNEGEKNEWGSLRGEYQWFLSRIGEIYRIVLKVFCGQGFGLYIFFFIVFICL